MAPKTFSEGTKTPEQASTSQAARTPGPPREMVRQLYFRMWEMSRRLSSRFYSFKPGVSRPTQILAATPDREHISLASLQAVKLKSHKLIRCSGAPRAQQSLSWHCADHGELGPKITNQTVCLYYSSHTPSGQRQYPSPVLPRTTRP